MDPQKRAEDLCGEESLAVPGLRCALPKNHHIHRSGGTAWATDWDAWRAEIEREVRAKVVEELRADAGAHRNMADRHTPHRDGFLQRADTLEKAAERITRAGRP